ncbi:MAG TPA: AAA family ATPase [Solirubrobacteraceae bacterium]|nr:AAA family ATPase [Solirubrobacteraceae bacterium]
MPKLPGQLQLTSSFPFAGRAGELATLRSLLPGTDAAAGGLRLALVGGEAGSGKSRLVRELAVAAADSALVLYGACDVVVRRPYGPFVEVLEQLIERTDGERLREALGGGSIAGELSRLLPDLQDHLGALKPPVSADPDTERHRLHSAVAELLAAAGRDSPMVIVIEDLHWADTPALLLLSHLARGVADARALLVATFRSTLAEVPEPLSDALVELRRAEGVVRLRLDGLAVEEVAELVAPLADAQPREVAHTAAALHELTGGNPFLITELWRSLAERDRRCAGDLETAAAVRSLGSPEGVREVVAHRLAHLSEGSAELLEIAAVAGSEFELPVVVPERLGEAELGAAIEQAVAHGMIEEVPSRPLAYRFSHELVRRAVYDRLPALRRAELHLLVGESLEHRTPPAPPAELAHHFTAAAAIDGPRRAVAYSLVAGRAALRSLDFDEAEARFASALQLGVPEPLERAAIGLELGAARFRGGRSREAIPAFKDAASIAREHGDAELLAAAAVGLEEACWRPAITDEGTIEMLQEASAKLPDGDSQLRVKVLAGSSRALAFVGRFGESSRAEGEAIAMARRLDDRRGLASVLARTYWTRTDQSLDHTLQMLTEARDLAEQLSELDLQAEAMEWRIAALIALGDLRAAELELTEVQELVARARQPFALHVAEHYASTLALCGGRLAQAEAAAQRSHEWSRLLTGRDASGVYGVQMFGVRREQGRLSELQPVLRMLAADVQAEDAWRPALALVLAELGLRDEAAEQLRRIRDDGLEPLRASLWVASLAYLAEACALVGDRDLAALVYAELAPLSGGNVVVGHGVACYGAADRFLGLLAGVLDDVGRADAHFVRAAALNRQMGAFTWLGHTLYAHGALLARVGDSARAAGLLDESLALARRIEMPALVARIGEVEVARDVAGGADGMHGSDGSGVVRDAAADELTGRELQILRLVAAGHSNRRVGEELSISGHTVANHVRSILRKTGACNRTEAAGYAFRHALIDRPADR